MAGCTITLHRSPSGLVSVARLAGLLLAPYWASNSREILQMHAAHQHGPAFRQRIRALMSDSNLDSDRPGGMHLHA